MTLAESLASQLSPGDTLLFGELSLHRTVDGVFQVQHCEDQNNSTELQALTSARELREWAKLDAEGNYRPLKTAPTLRSGWRAETESSEEFLSFLDAIYPGAFATWIAYSTGQLSSVSLEQTLNRQTGMYRIAAKLDSTGKEHIRTEYCSQICIREVAWPTEKDGQITEPIVAELGTIPLICTEACTFAVNKARKLAKSSSQISATECSK